MSNIRGIESKHEHAAQKVARDTRPLGTRFAEFISNPVANFIISGTGVVGCIMFSIIADIILLICFSLFLFSYISKHTLPFRLPRSAKAKDWNDLIPGTHRARMSQGISFLGNDRITQEELWFNNDDLRTHILIFGSTGSGKTEALVSLAFNSLIHGSGFIYIDGKGDNSLFAKIFSMARMMGRDDDLLLINFMTGARDVIGPQENRLSNTMNPFASGSSSMLSQLVVSLMDAGSNNSSGDMWKGRAINFVESLMKILTVMRDRGVILLDANTIRDFFILEKLETIVIDRKFPLGNFGERSVDIKDVPEMVIEPLKNYVLNLPGYNPKKKGDQGSEVREQHGFITMQLTRVFGSLADTYGHILRTNLAEVDLKDVVLNRRILIVLLPALEKSPDELSSLGKIIIASLKAMMAAGLGDTVEGDYRDVILRKPTNAISPYVCIMDEYGYYAVQGFAVVPAQARSLGFSAVFAGQDLPAFQKASKEEAASIGANCNIKICMKLEDPQETWEFFQKVAGETYVTNVSGFQINSGSLTMNYMDTKNASVDRRQRIELLDLKDQREGECHIFFKSKIVRAEFFYANPAPVKKMRINHFLKIAPPSDIDLVNLDKRLQLFKKIIDTNELEIPEYVANDDINVFVSALENDSKKYKPFERGLVALIAILEAEVNKQRAISEPYENNETEDSMSIFTKIPTGELVTTIISEGEVELFTLPLVRRGSTRDNIQYIERLTGKSMEDSMETADRLIADLEKVTEYPPMLLFQPERESYMKAINGVISLLGGTKFNFNKMIDIDNTFEGNDDDSSDLDDLNDVSELEELPELPDFEDFENMLDHEEEEENEEDD